MRSAKLLLVEDEGLVALDIEQRLTQLGYVVVGTVDNATGAIAMLRESQPDLVLMDIRLRGPLDGVDLARDLSTRYELPVVFLTGNADEATLQRAMETEPYGYALKPFDMRTLEAVIETALFRWRAERRLQGMRRWLADAMRSIPDSVLATDLDGRITFVNRAGELMLGRELAELINRPLDEVVACPKLTGLVGACLASRGEGGAAAPVRRRMTIKGVDYDVSVGPILSGAEGIGSVVLFCER